jgi:hypothetical protein
MSWRSDTASTIVGFSRAKIGGRLLSHVLFWKEGAAAGRQKADFNEKTRRILGDRAGWRCSVPGCNRPTVGPGHGDEEVARTGTAAHIHSAALSGPRGRGTLTDKQLASASNGIWCCADHGRAPLPPLADCRDETIGIKTRTRLSALRAAP